MSHPGGRQGLLRVAAPVVALFGAASWLHPTVAGSDLWWHLASGREIWRLGAVPSTDSFSFTFEGRPWLNHEWLWDVVYWGVYQLHPQAVAWGNLGVALAIFALVFAVARRLSGSALAAGAAVWLAAATAHWFIEIRPHLFTLLFVTIVMLTRERPWAPWLWPALVLVWVNLHAGFAFGVGAIGLHVLVRTAQESGRQRRLVLLGREWAGLALAIAAVGMNPFGYQLLEYPLSYLQAESPYRTIVEWRPPGFGLDPASFQGRLWIAATVALLGAPAAARRAPYLLALSVVSFGMALTSRRFIPLFAVISAPIAALALATALRGMASRWPVLRGSGAARVALAVSLVMGALLWREVRLYPDLLHRSTQSDLYPEAAVRYLNALGPPERLLNDYSWGGYLLLHAPKSRVMIDGRANTLYDDAINRDYASLARGSPEMEARLARYPADAAILRPGPFVDGLMRLDPPWRPVYRGTLAVILLPPDSRLLEGRLPSASEVLGLDHPEVLRARARLALFGGDLEAAIRDSEAALERDPLAISSYGQLALLHAARGSAAAVARSIERGLRAYPRRWADLRSLEGQAFEQMGELRRALRAYRASVCRGPAGDADGKRPLLRRLEDEIRRSSRPE